MSGRGRGRGRGGGRGGGRGRGRGYRGGSSNTTPKVKGLLPALGEHVFSYDQKGAADQMRTSLKQLVKHTGTCYGQDISNELHNRTKVVIPEPQHHQDILDAHQADIIVREEAYERLKKARVAREKTLKNAAKTDPALGMELAVLQNDMAEAAHNHAKPFEITLTGDARVKHEGSWRTYRERTSLLEKQRGQTFSMILGQCTQQLHDRMKQDSTWTAVSTSYDPLALLSLIEKIVMAQTEDQYPFAIVYEHEVSLYGYMQNQLSNDLW